MLKCVECTMQPNTTLHDCILSHDATMAFGQGWQIRSSLGTIVRAVTFLEYGIMSFMNLIEDIVAEE